MNQDSKPSSDEGSGFLIPSSSELVQANIKPSGEVSGFQIPTSSGELQDHVMIISTTSQIRSGAQAIDEFHGTGIFTEHRRDEIMQPFKEEYNKIIDDYTYLTIIKAYIQSISKSKHFKYTESLISCKLMLDECEQTNLKEKYLSQLEFELVKQYHLNNPISQFIRNFQSTSRSAERVQFAYSEGYDQKLQKETASRFVDRLKMEISIELWKFYTLSRLQRDGQRLMTRREIRENKRMAMAEYKFAEKLLGITRNMRLRAEAIIEAEPHGQQRISTIIQQMAMLDASLLNEIMMKVLRTGALNVQGQEGGQNKKNQAWLKHDILDEKTISRHIESFWIARTTMNKTRLALKKMEELLICGDCGIMMNLLDKHKHIHWRSLFENELVPPSQIYSSKFTKYIKYDESMKKFRVCRRCFKNPISQHTLLLNESSLQISDAILRIHEWQLKKALQLGFIHAQVKSVHEMISNEMYYPHLEGYVVCDTHDGRLGALQSELIDAELKHRWWTRFMNHNAHKQHLAVAIDWLKRNNHLYEVFFCNWEVLDMVAANPSLKEVFSKFEGSDISILRKDMRIGSKYKVEDKDNEGMSNFMIEQRENAIALVDEEAYEQARQFYLIPVHASHYDHIGEEQGRIRDGIAIEAFKRISETEDIMKKIKDIRESKIAIQEEFKVEKRFSNPYLEEMLHPTLLPYGKGGFNNCYLPLGWTLKQYAKKRLLQIIPLFRMDSDWVFFMYDRIKREEILGFNKVRLIHPSKYDKKLTQGYVKQIEQKAQDDAKGKKGSTWEVFNQQLSRKHTDSPQYMEQKYYALVRLIEKFGNPHIFLTLTLDERDPYYITLKEVMKKIRKEAGDKGTHVKLSRHDPLPLLANFYNKCREVIRGLYGKEDSIFGETNAYFEKVEFQERGAPHYHILLWLPPKQLKKLNDGFLIQAHLPEDPVMRERVLKYQVHGHTEMRCFKGNHKDCRYGYPFQPKIVDSIIGNRWLYARMPGDEMIVPFNPHLLMMFDGGHHISRLTPSDITQYMAKYVAKVNPQLDVMIKYPSGEVQQAKINEVVHQVKTRKVAVMSAMWTMLGLSTVTSSPEVKFVDISIPDQKWKILKPRGQREQLNEDSEDIYISGLYDRYLARPRLNQDWQQLTFQQFVEKCNYTDVKENVPKYAAATVVQVRFEGRLSYYFFRQSEIVAQFKKWYPQQGPQYFHYIYMKRVPHYEDTKWSPENVACRWDYECYLRGVVHMDYATLKDDVKAQYQITSVDKDELQGMLLQLMANNEIDELTKHTIGVHVEVIQEMLDEDVIGPNGYKQQYVIDHDYQQMLKEIADQSKHEEPKTDGSAEFIEQFLGENINAIPLMIEDLRVGIQSDDGFSLEQKAALSYIYDNVTSKDSQCLLFIHGAGGTGKSHLIKHIRTLFQHCLHKRLRVTATTGKVASQIQGETIHRLMQFSDYTDRVLVEAGTPQQIKLEGTHCILIDEISMLDSRSFNSIDDILKKAQIKDKQKRVRPFGGCHVILMGDPLQLMPIIVNKEGKEKNSLLTNSLFMQYFKWIELTTNFRQKGDYEYAELLKRVRYGEHTKEDLKILSTRVCNSPRHLRSNECEMLGTCDLVLTGRKDNREKINQLTIKKIFPKESAFIIKATDFISKTADDQDIVRNVSTITNLQDADNITRIIDEYFEHELLKVLTVHIEMKVMITKNLLVKNSQTNGTMEIVKNVGPGYKYIEILNLATNEIQLISPIQLSFYSEELGERLTRLQFPIVPAYACTVHKAQGQTLKTVKLCAEDMFADGQFYTGISRVTSIDGLHLTCLEEDKILTNKYSRMICKGRQELSKETINEFTQEKYLNRLINYVTDKLLQYSPKEIKIIQNYYDMFKTIQQDQLMKTTESEVQSSLAIKNEEKKDDVDMQDVEAAQRIKRYPWIYWFRNSCLQDSFVTIFYFTVWNKIPGMKQDELLQSTLLFDACKELDKIPIMQEFMNDAQDQRWHHAIQLLRTEEGIDFSNIDSIRQYTDDNPAFCLIKKRVFQCDIMACNDKFEEPSYYESFQTVIEKGQVEWNINNAFKPIDKQVCRKCGKHSTTISFEIQHCPKVLQVALSYGDDIDFQTRQLITLRNTNGSRYSYELQGMMTYITKAVHFVSYVKNGQHFGGNNLQGWWRSDSKLNDIRYHADEAWDPMSVRLNLRAERPALLVYRLLD